MLLEIRAPLLEEARQSPSLLSDLAGLEQYIAESYDSRSFIELLQNADDAGASRFVIQRSGEFLLVANDGRRFTRLDFESLCRSAASSKTRGRSIGYRGIGFKSVVGFARTIHLISGDLEATFSRERTAREIPQATRVPLVRIPHQLEDADRAKFSAALDHLVDDRLATVFIFDRLLAGGIEKEFAAFNPTSLLFLRNLRQMELRANTEALISVRREVINPHTRSISLTSDDGKSQWTVIEQQGIAIAFRREADRIVRLDEREAVVHAFLPTLEPTGLAVKIHGDISTDPSRTRVIFDERTAKGLNDIAALVVALFEESLFGDGLPDPAGIIAGLVPFSDPRMASLLRQSFKTELFAAIQRYAKGRFENLRCRPTWLNALDFETLAKSAGVRVVPRAFENIEGLNGLLRFLGAKEATIEELSPSLSITSVTIPGAAEVASHLVQRHTTKQMDPKSIRSDWQIWPVGGKVVSFEEAKAAAKPLDRAFVDMVAEKSGGGTECRRLIAELGNETIAFVLMPEISVQITTQGKKQSDNMEGSEVALNDLPVQHLSLKRWRSAEQQVLNLLVAQGWKVEDVSRQNLGYDIEGQTSDGEEVFIEVKAIDQPGQPFTITSNEEAVARQKGLKYRLAIVRTSNSFLEVAFVRDPVQQLTLTRQCRQWVWECSEYPFNPKRFPIE
jgi:hypothetical protein